MLEFERHVARARSQGGSPDVWLRFHEEGPPRPWPMADGRWPMMSPGAVSGRYARPAVPLARDTCR
eukprot:5597985-Prymnesium_polylepis.1